MQKILQKCIKSNWSYIILAAIASGLYTMIHTYGTNFQFANTWAQFRILLLFYIAFPIVVFSFIFLIVSKISILKKYKKFSIPILNATFFTLFILGKTYGFNARKIVVLSFVGATLLAILLWKHYKKVVIFQYLIALVAFVKIPPMLYEYITRSETWLQQPDAIETATFKKHPNIYVIQPDGYVNFSELRKEAYNFDNSDFEDFLKAQHFKNYDNYRSNYMSTLLSNSSMFTMKHHHIIGHESKAAQFGLRSKIVSDNAVLTTLKNNDYKTFLFLEYPYLIMNRPQMGYDVCNISYGDIPWLGVNTFHKEFELIEPLKKAIHENQNSRNFYFIEKILPSHITAVKDDGTTLKENKAEYLKRLASTNDWLKETITVITKNDPNSMIVITADHGGFVGLDYYAQITEKQTDRDKIYSVFSAVLAIKWPQENVPAYDEEIQSPVNLFRILFSYLSENTNYITHLEKDQSFSLILEDAPYGVYEYIDDDGKVVFNKFEEAVKKE